MDKNILHDDFQLNETTFTSATQLLSFCKVNYPETHSFLKQWFSKSKTIKVQTSGSTGKPKTIMLQKQHMVNSAFATQSFFKLPSKTKALLCLSTNHIAGKMMLVRSLVLGWHLDIVKVSSNPLQTVTKHYGFCAMVPLQVHHSLSKLNIIDKLIIGGAAISSELKDKLQNRSTQAYATYGMTETCTHIAVKKLNHVCHAELDSASHYNTLPNIHISKDNRNCLIINAPKISEETIITNDIVHIIDDSTFELLGRYDNIINSGGIKIIPEQVELKLTSLIQQRYFVIGVPDKLLGEKVVLVIEGEENTHLKSKISNIDTLTKYEFPKEIYFINKFVETSSGKIQRTKTLAYLK